jgi:hypothetical protein
MAAMQWGGIMIPEKRMKMKGSGVMGLPAFVKSAFPERFEDWIRALSPESREIHAHPILASEWYPLYETYIDPSQKMCDLFFDGDMRGAWESGKFSASYGLNGIYKVFFKIGSPQFIIDRASRVFNTYYSDGELRVAESSSNRCVLHISNFPEPYPILDQDIGGWLEGTLELLKCGNGRVEITHSQARGDSLTEFVATWE